MWFRPEVLSLITTHQCTAACEHCCFGCAPQVRTRIPAERLAALVDETAEVPSLRTVVFTGGECFLLGRDLDALISRCARRGLTTRCVTNGSWAASPAIAARRVEELRAAGLEELNFSTGDHHARYVPWERVVFGAEAAARAGLGRIAIHLETFEGAALAPADLEGHPRLRPHLAAGRIQLNAGPWVPAGYEWSGCSAPRALPHPESSLRFAGQGRTPCDSSLLTVSVTPTLDLVSCCGLNLEHIPQLRVASLARLTLREALEAVPVDLLKMWIHLEGPERVLEFVRERDPGFPLPLDSAHICHTCQYLHGNARALEILARHQRDVEDRVLERFLAASACREIAARAGAGA